MGGMLHICKVVDALKWGWQGHKALVGNHRGLPRPSVLARPTIHVPVCPVAFDRHPRLPLQYNFAHTLSHVYTWCVGHSIIFWVHFGNFKPLYLPHTASESRSEGGDVLREAQKARK